MVYSKVPDRALAEKMVAAIDKAENDAPSQRRALAAVLDLYLHG
jgi:hypothetical protein